MEGLLEALVAVLGVLLPLANAVVQRFSREEKLFTDESPDKGPSSEGSLSSKKSRLRRYFTQLFAEVVMVVHDPKERQLFDSLCQVAKSELNRAGDDETFASAEFSISRVESELKRYKYQVKQRSNARFNGIVISLVFLSAETAFLYFAPQLSIDGKAPIYMIDVPGFVVFWAFVGSYTAILYRFSNQGDWELLNPTRWLYTRPVTGLVLGTLTYLMLQVGVVAFTSGASAVRPGGTVDPQGAPLPSASTALLSLLAFLAGFSDRFADGLLLALTGRLGGNRDAGLISGGTATSSAR
jgi:hypothetical protein